MGIVVEVFFIIFVIVSCAVGYSIWEDDKLWKEVERTVEMEMPHINITPYDKKDSVLAETAEKMANYWFEKVNQRACAYHDSVIESLKAGRGIEIRGFGTFKVRKKSARLARNPKTGEKVNVAEHFVPVFKFSKDFKTAVSKGMAEKGTK